MTATILDGRGLAKTLRADLAEQVAGGAQTICGVMIESHLLEGRQTRQPGKPLVYGQSITDACVSWETTVPLLESLAEAVRTRRASKKRVHVKTRAKA